MDLSRENGGSSSYSLLLRLLGSVARIMHVSCVGEFVLKRVWSHARCSASHMHAICCCQDLSDDVQRSPYGAMASSLIKF